jgi:hypothetical protein
MIQILRLLGSKKAARLAVQEHVGTREASQFESYGRL